MFFSINEIKELLNSKLINNNSGGQVSLSPSESLLLLINVCESLDENKKLPFVSRLHQLYIGGIKTIEDKQLILNLKEALKSKNYTLQLDAHSINQDATRRYFETQLAYQILQNQAERLNTKELQSYAKNLKKYLFAKKQDAAFQQKVEMILTGKMDNKILNKYELEYAELIHLLLNNNYFELSPLACKNLYYIAVSSILATLNTKVIQNMPVNIYNDSIFTMGMDGRGRAIKHHHEQVTTATTGLMLSTSPLPIYDKVVNPSQGKKKSPFQRSADQATYMIESQWCQLQFSHLVHPYSNGISSTTLAQLRNIILQKRLDNVHHHKKLTSFLTMFASLMVLNSGGHTYFEIFEVLKQPQFKSLVQSEPGMARSLAADRLMYDWLYIVNYTSYTQAMKATQDYGQLLLNKKILNAQFSQRKNNSLNAETQSVSIHQALIELDEQQFKMFLTRYQGNIDQGNKKQWPPLMVAAQLGKTEHVLALIQHKATINGYIKKTKEQSLLSALEVAIKNQHVETVEVLVNAGASIIKSEQGHLRDRSPALYYACRQSDKRILELLLKKETHFTPKDIKMALSTALSIEAVEALEVLIHYLVRRKNTKVLTPAFKYHLLNETVALGNPELFETLIKCPIWGSSNHTEYHYLINLAVEKGFIPMAIQILRLSTQANASKTRIDLNNILSLAIENHHFDLAIILILKGASPNSLNSSQKHLHDFSKHIKHTKYYYNLLSTEDPTLIANRALAIKRELNESKSSIIHKICIAFIKFLNHFLPVSLKICFYDKELLIKNIITRLESKDRTGLIEKSKDNETIGSINKKSSHLFFSATNEQADKSIPKRPQDQSFFLN